MAHVPPRYLVFVAPCPHGERGSSTHVRVVKGWYGPGLTGGTRLVHEFCVPRGDEPESEVIARGLEAAAAALRG